MVRAFQMNPSLPFICSLGFLDSLQLQEHRDVESLHGVSSSPDLVLAGFELGLGRHDRSSLTHLDVVIEVPL